MASEPETQPPFSGQSMERLTSLPDIPEMERRTAPYLEPSSSRSSKQCLIQKTG